MYKKIAHTVLIMFIATFTSLAQEKYSDKEIGFDREKEEKFLLSLGVKKTDLSKLISARRNDFAELYRHSRQEPIKGSSKSISMRASPCEILPDGIDGTFQSCESVAGQFNPNSNVTCGGWFNGFGTADTWKFPIDATYDGFSDNMIPSPDGGVIAGAISTAGESFYASIDNLQVGSTYLLRFYQSHGTTLQTGLPSDYTRWQITFGSEVKYSDDVLITEFPQWTYQEIEFTATSSNQTLTFKAAKGAQTSNAYSHMYTLIDGVEFSESSISLEGTIEISSEQNPCTNDSIGFNFVSPNATDIDSYTWNIIASDNSIIDTLSGNPAEYSFSEAGDYTIEVIVTSGECEDSFAETLSISECEACTECTNCNSFTPNPGEIYVVSAWVKENHSEQQMDYTSTSVRVIFLNDNSSIGLPVSFNPSGDIIDGWQRIKGEFTIPSGTTNISLDLVNSSSQVQAYFDDVRVHPFNGNMKSFVYDQKTQQLMAELDENNYATFYEYDKEGGLIRVKKETKDGVYTIQETRSGNAKDN